MPDHRKLAGLALAAAMVLAAGCERELRDPALEGPIPFRPERPMLPAPGTATPYTGQNPLVLEAQEKLRTGYDLHAKVVFRTCSPNGGVCHNSKEYPDLRTPASFLSVLDAPCNVQPGSWEAVFDRCERPGDRIALGKETREIAWLNHVLGERKGDAPPDRTTPGLHVHLAEPLSSDREQIYEEARFIRSFAAGPRVEDLAFAGFSTRWWLLENGQHLYAEVSQDRLSRVQALLATGVVQGDHNRNGRFGAREGTPVPLLRPGKPEESYLIGRLRGTMLGTAVPGSRMPLANQPLSVPEMLALFCFVEGMGTTGGASMANLDTPIDYGRCSYSAAPENLNLLGSGVTWARRVKQILEFNCGGCHSENQPQLGLILVGAGVYKRLLEPSVQKPELPLVKPRDPAGSYLWLKLTGAPGITGSRMPFNPLTGQGRLGDAELADIKNWIEAGAIENE